jgi:hypothetical protein
MNSLLNFLPALALASALAFSSSAQAATAHCTVDTNDGKGGTVVDSDFDLNDNGTGTTVYETSENYYLVGKSSTGLSVEVANKNNMDISRSPGELSQAETNEKGLWVIYTIRCEMKK